jgi:hypothetical protein
MRQRVRHQCCTRGRFRPAHPRQLAEVLVRDVPARHFLCARCREPVLVCSHCDRGQIYCPTGCATVARRQSQREAGRRYQRSLPGRFKHAARSRRWRQRQALLAVPVAPAATATATATAQSVTHQGSPTPTSDAVLTASPSPVAAAAASAASAPPTQPCKSIATSTASTATTPASPAVGAAGADQPVPTPASTSPLTRPTWRCHWCRTPCAADVRLGFLRHNPAARKASRRAVPSHGHSP